MDVPLDRRCKAQDKHRKSYGEALALNPVTWNEDRKEDKIEDAETDGVDKCNL